jgi:hypothetical protein
MALASEYQLHDLIGKRVRTMRPFEFLPAGSVGEVIEISGRPGGPPALVVQWDRENFKDRFGRDRNSDETRWLEVLDV